MAGEGSKTLIIAEKPSVAGDIVKALPEKFDKLDAYYESPSYIVSFAIGHLVSIANPKDMDERLKEWGLNNLPIIPEKFVMRTIYHCPATAPIMFTCSVAEVEKLQSKGELDVPAHIAA